MSDKTYTGAIKIGLLTVPFGNHATFPEITQWSGKGEGGHGYDCLSIGAWPLPEKSASQRGGEDAFVAAHCGDLETFNEARASEMKGAMKEAGIEPYSMALFENMSTANVSVREQLHKNFEHACRIGSMIGAKYIGTFPGRNEDMSEGDALKFFIERIGPKLQKVASDYGLKPFFENCIMEGLIGKPGRVVGNVAYCPANFRRIFDALDGWFMNPDPSHMVWQGIDYEKVLEEFPDRIVEVHAKDAHVLERWLRPEATRDMEPMPFRPENYDTGIVHDDHPICQWGAGLYNHAAPGLGDVKWSKVTGQMRETGLAERGVPLMVEIEDEAFSPRSPGADNCAKAAFAVAIRTLRPYCSADQYLL